MSFSTPHFTSLSAPKTSGISKHFNSAQKPIMGPYYYWIYLLIWVPQGNTTTETGSATWPPQTCASSPFFIVSFPKSKRIYIYILIKKKHQKVNTHTKKKKKPQNHTIYSTLTTRLSLKII